MIRLRILGLVDALLHRIGRPCWRVCDAYDIALGVDDTPWNFPRRHGYVMLQHVFTGSSSHPEAATCQHCGQGMDNAGPCLIVKAAP